MMNNILRMVLLSLAALLAACGGDDDEIEIPSQPAPESSAPPPTSNPLPSSPSPSNPSQADPPPSSPPPSNPAPPPPPNGAPVIGGSPSSQVLVDSPYVFIPSASDPDGDVLTFRIRNRPPWAAFDPATGQLSGTPSADDVHRYDNIRITATDGDATVALAAFSIEVVATATGSATLTWMAPTTRTDGSALQVEGYKVYWGTESRDYTKSTTLDAGFSTYVIDELTPGTWYFAITALDDDNLESEFSTEVSKHVAF